MPNFCNISVSGTVLGTFEAEYHGKSSADLLLDFIEAGGDGCKLSFSYKESKSAYCVAVTLPDLRNEGEFVCATFWSDEIYDALLEAHVVLFAFDGLQAGFYHAKAEIAKYEKEMARAFKQMQEEGNTPIKTRIRE